MVTFAGKIRTVRTEGGCEIVVNEPSVEFVQLATEGNRLDDIQMCVDRSAQ